jgi:hypothetical protein
MGPALRVRIPSPKDGYRAAPMPAKKQPPKPPVETEADDFDEEEQLDDDLFDVG